MARTGSTNLTRFSPLETIEPIFRTLFSKPGVDCGAPLWPRGASRFGTLLRNVRYGTRPNGPRPAVAFSRLRDKRLPPPWGAEPSPRPSPASGRRQPQVAGHWAGYRIGRSSKASRIGTHHAATKARRNQPRASRIMCERSAQWLRGARIWSNLSSPFSPSRRTPLMKKVGVALTPSPEAAAACIALTLSSSA